MRRFPWMLRPLFCGLCCVVLSAPLVVADAASDRNGFDASPIRDSPQSCSSAVRADPLEKQTLQGDNSRLTHWQRYVGQAGPTGWRAHVIAPDPLDHGPDGINLHDWDHDGALDMFVNYEEGEFSRLYFNPGNGKLHKRWHAYIEFQHGKCEDSGCGDLDDDGDIDYIANGGWVYFNPGANQVRDQSKWTKMTLFNHEQRVPTVVDIDGDGLNDLVVGAQSWYKQPVHGKHDPKNWKQYHIGQAIWPMSCLVFDVDKDGDRDLVVADRRKEVFWYVNGGAKQVTSRWPRKLLHQHTAMFMTVGDVNQDGVDDFVIAGGGEGAPKYKHHLIVLLRTNRSGDPTFREILVRQPCGDLPKGVAIIEIDGDPMTQEIVVTPEFGELWKATYSGDPMDASNWRAEAIAVPGAETRLKMDNVYRQDLDGDGDVDIVTTEENGGWGVIWFENPLHNRTE